MFPLTRQGDGWKHRLCCALAVYPTKQPPIVAVETVTVNASPDLVIAQQSSQATVQTGDLLTYTIIVRNVGNQGAREVLIADVLPHHVKLINVEAGAQGADGVVTWPQFSLEAGDAVERMVTVQVGDGAAMGVKRLLNRVSVRSLELDPTPLNNAQLKTTIINNSLATNEILLSIYLPLIAR